MRMRPRRANFWRIRRTATRDHGDAGLTLVELLISMSILALFLALFGTSLLGAAKGVRKQSGVVDAQTFTRTAFELLDKQIRYAEAVTAPSTGDAQWIEWQVPDPSIPTAQSVTQSRCFQWRATTSTGLLQYRTWIVPTTGVVATPAWDTVASGVVVGSVPVFTITTSGLQASPFYLPSAGQTYSLSHMQVGVALNISVNNPAGRAAASTVFTALNAGTTPGSVCSQVARV